MVLVGSGAFGRDAFREPLTQAYHSRGAAIALPRRCCSIMASGGKNSVEDLRRLLAAAEEEDAAAAKAKGAQNAFVAVHDPYTEVLPMSDVEPASPTTPTEPLPAH